MPADIVAFEAAHVLRNLSDSEKTLLTDCIYLFKGDIVTNRYFIDRLEVNSHVSVRCLNRPLVVSIGSIGGHPVKINIHYYSVLVERTDGQVIGFIESVSDLSCGNVVNFFLTYMRPRKRKLHVTELESILGLI
ncbi:MAG: hypothetical protein V4473_02630 [Patescibacteria group bacterium]